LHDPSAHQFIGLKTSSFTRRIKTTTLLTALLQIPCKVTTVEALYQDAAPIKSKNTLPLVKGGAKVDHWGGAKGYQQSER
jgi:hypothetical protein